MVNCIKRCCYFTCRYILDNWPLVYKSTYTRELEAANRVATAREEGYWAMLRRSNEAQQHIAQLRSEIKLLKVKLKKGNSRV